MLPTYYPTLALDIHVVMPNHLHGILYFDDNPTTLNPTLGVVIGTYKAGVTRQARYLLELEGKLWQGRYHDTIIRDEKALAAIQAHIVNNPLKWSEDVHYLTG
jgi:REP element-mobilizing transposase RayT